MVQPALQLLLEELLMLRQEQQDVGLEGCVLRAGCVMEAQHDVGALHLKAFVLASYIHTVTHGSGRSSG